MGHYQPHIPADLGFYDLRLPETREDQAKLAREYGIEGFCYYHYWFGGGRRILERPLEEVVRSGQPDFPFCMCWANETWTGVWHGAGDRILVEQTYPGDEDDRAHFAALLPAFSDRRHVRVDGKPLFLIYKPELLPEPSRMLGLWRELAIAAGLSGLHILGMNARPTWIPQEHGFDGEVVLPLIENRPWISRRRPLRWLWRQASIRAGLPSFHDARRFVPELLAHRTLAHDWHPCLIHAWDNTPRSGRNGVVLHHASPAQFAELLRAAVDLARTKPPERRLVFLKSWNEWAEGNHLEPDLRHGRDYLDVLKAVLAEGSQTTR